MLLENLLRTEDGANITADDIRAIAGWDADADPSKEIQFTPARVIMQDFTGVPCVVDLATMREAMADLGGDPTKINPLAPAEMVIDHSVIADVFGTPEAFERNVEIEYERNRERYQFLRWGQGAFDDFKVVPPGTGIVHQVNIEHLARTIFTREVDGELQAYPDTCVGTDSHTTMVNGIGVVGWGVGGIEAEAAMLGQPVSMLIPRVVGFKLNGDLPEGATATDLVLTITEMLRKHGVVGKFVEFYGPGVSVAAAGQPRHDRQHEPRVRLDDRGLPDRRGDHRSTSSSPVAATSSSRWSRPTPRSRASGTTPTPSRATPRSSSSTWPRSSRRWPARSARRTGCRCPTPRTPSAAPWPTTSTRPARRRGTTRRRRVLPGLRRALPRRQRLRAAEGVRHRRPPPMAAGRATRRSSSWPTAPSSRSTTAPSRSRRSRRAPTRPTRR